MEYDPMKYLVIKPDQKNHIKIKNQRECHLQCKRKECTIICPTDVFFFHEHLEIRYWRCLECGACAIICQNIEWEFPHPPYGVSYKK